MEAGCNPLTGLFQLQQVLELMEAQGFKYSCNPLTGLFQLQPDSEENCRARVSLRGCNPLTGLFQLQRGQMRKPSTLYALRLQSPYGAIPVATRSCRFW